MMGEARDQIGTAEEWTLLLAESGGNCPFRGHWGEADISISLPDAKLEFNHNSLVMDNLDSQVDCTQKAREIQDAGHSREEFP